MCLSEKVQLESPIFNPDVKFLVIKVWDRKRFQNKIKRNKFKDQLLRNLNWPLAKSVMMKKVSTFPSWVNKRRKLQMWIQKTLNLLIWANVQKNRLKNLIKMRKIQKRSKITRKMLKSLPKQNFVKKKIVLNYLQKSLKKSQNEDSDGDWGQFINASQNWLIQRSQNGKTRKILRNRKLKSMLIQSSKFRKVWIN